MKLIEALQIIQRPSAEGTLALRVMLATGFTPLHLETFLAAHLRVASDKTLPEVKTGLFGDLAGNLERLDSAQIDSLVVAMEWSDFDPRLGVRTLGGWRPEEIDGIIKSAGKAADRIERAIAQIGVKITAIVSLPTLLLPPMFSTHSVQSSAPELQLRGIVSSLAACLAGLPNVRLVSEQQLGIDSAPACRYDLKSDLLNGFPYTVTHASVLAKAIASLIHNQRPMKGLITDLDNTLWAGIVGDDGIEGISWNLERHTQVHGIYQQLLSSLAGAGVLIGVASKNDPELVKQAFMREDLLISPKDIFPIEAHWSPKSESVERILRTWNISADAVVFVDDSPMEIAEVKAAFPEMDCRLFSGNDYSGTWELLRSLREAFGKAIVTHEDALRLESIRSSSAWRDLSSSEGNGHDEFLASVEASIVFEYGPLSEDTRAFELINKTNQFNLNGRRISQPEWRNFFADQSAFLLTVAYKDKFGPLGKIAAMMGRIHGGKAEITGWVMSCRAFSRRIEHQCLKFVFENLGAEEIAFDYEGTQRNGPLTDFLADVLKRIPEPGATLTREGFLSNVPELFHRIEVSVNV